MGLLARLGAGRGAAVFAAIDTAAARGVQVRIVGGEGISTDAPAEVTRPGASLPFTWPMLICTLALSLAPRSRFVAELRSGARRMGCNARGAAGAGL